MIDRKVLVIGGGIGGLTAAVALRQKGFAVDLIERDPNWSVYGVGIIQQSNSIRAMAELGLLEKYINAGFGYETTDAYLPNGQMVAAIPGPRLVPNYPANVGIARPALQKVLADAAKEAGTVIRLGVTADEFEDDDASVTVTFSDGSRSSYHAVAVAEGAYSATRAKLMPDAPKPEFTGQSVWRYNFPRPEYVKSAMLCDGRNGVGLVPLGPDLMYMFITSGEPGNPRYPLEGMAAAMRDRLKGLPSPFADFSAQITQDEGVVYRPLETLLITGDWHLGRIVFLGDAVHTTTPHLAQGAGMAIEDAIVLADELAKDDAPVAAFQSYRERRFDRCRYIVENATTICQGQLGIAPKVDVKAVMQGMLQRVAMPI